MISLLDFMPHETTHATNRHMLDTPGRYLAATGEFGGHHRGLKWPSMGIFHWPPTMHGVSRRAPTQARVRTHRWDPGRWSSTAGTPAAFAFASTAGFSTHTRFRSTTQIPIATVAAMIIRTLACLGQQTTTACCLS